MTRRRGPLPFALNIAITNAWVSQLFDQELQRNGGKLGLATMCIGVGQGIALAIERV